MEVKVSLGDVRARSQESRRARNKGDLCDGDGGDGGGQRGGARSMARTDRWLGSVSSLSFALVSVQPTEATAANVV